MSVVVTTVRDDDIIQNVVAAAVCFVVVVHARLHCTTSSMSAEMIAEARFFSDVINFRLEQVIIPTC